MQVSRQGEDLEPNAPPAAFLERTFLFKLVEAGLVRHRSAKVVERLPDRAEVAGRKVGNGGKPPRLGIPKARLEHPLEERPLAVSLKVVELKLERESPHDRRVEVVHEVGRPDHHALEVFHAAQELVDLRHLPAALRPGTILYEAVDFVKEQNRVVRLCFVERPLDVLFRLAHPA